MTLWALSVLLLLVGQVLILTVEGMADVQTVSTGIPFVERIRSAPPRSSVRAGDIIDFRLLPASVRWQWYETGIRRGKSYTLAVIRNGNPNARQYCRTAGSILWRII
jgi:hypothetical protein